MRRCKSRRIGVAIAWRFAAVFFLSSDFGCAGEPDPIGPKTLADVQCVAVGARLSGSQNQAQSQAGEMLLIYFLGRIDGRSPHADLEALVEQEAKKMTATDFADWARRCGAEFSARGEQFTQIGKNLQLSGK